MLDSILRTAVPYLVGALIVLAAKFGLALHPDMTVTQMVTFAVSLAYYWLARLVERAAPGLGRALLSFGLARGGQPQYVRTVKGPTERLPGM